MEPKVLDLNEIVTDLQELLGRTIGEHITLRIRLDPDLSAVRIDPSAIYQVVMNLVINARDAMAQGGTLTVETVNVEIAPRVQVQVDRSAIQSVERAPAVEVREKEREKS